MAFKDVWKPRIDGVDNADSSAVNEIAEAVIDNEDATKKNANNILKKQDALTDKQLQNIDDVSFKQNALSEEQLKNIQDVPNKADTEYVNKTFTNILKGTASGEAIGMHDVSPVEHTMAVKVRSKNLFDKNNYTVGYRVKNTDGTLSPSSTGYCATDYIPVEGGKTYVVSGYVANDSTTRHVAYYDCDKVFVSGVSTERILTVPKNACFVRKTLHQDDVETYQIEEGTTATAYTPYVEDVSGISVQKYGENLNTVIATYVSNADGTVEGVTSLYPSTTLLTDTEGVVIDCEYNRDINKAFEELMQAIISLGGNV